jgi:uncharacterized protein
MTTLQAAAKWGNIETVSTAFRFWCKFNALLRHIEGVTAFQAGTGWGNLKMVQALIAAGADVNTPTRDEGRTALQVVAKWGDFEMTQALLAAGVDANALGSDGRTALQTAVVWGSLVTVQLLLASDDVNTPATNEGPSSGS